MARLHRTHSGQEKKEKTSECWHSEDPRPPDYTGFGESPSFCPFVLISTVYTGCVRTCGQQQDVENKITYDHTIVARRSYGDEKHIKHWQYSIE